MKCPFEKDRLFNVVKSYAVIKYILGTRLVPYERKGCNTLWRPGVRLRRKGKYNARLYLYLCSTKQNSK